VGPAGYIGTAEENEIQTLEAVAEALKSCSDRSLPPHASATDRSCQILHLSKAGVGAWFAYSKAAESHCGTAGGAP